MLAAMLCKASLKSSEGKGVEDKGSCVTYTILKKGEPTTPISQDRIGSFGGSTGGRGEGYLLSSPGYMAPLISSLHPPCPSITLEAESGYRCIVVEYSHQDSLVKSSRAVAVCSSFVLLCNVWVPGRCWYCTLWYRSLP